MPMKRDDGHTRGRSRSIPLGLAAAGASCLLGACSADVVSLGERQDELAVPAHSRCQSSTTLEGPVRVESQEQLDALEGCAVIAGDLDIVAFPSGNLRSLHALTRVEGKLTIGGHPPGVPADGQPFEEWVTARAEYEASIVDWLPSLEGLEQLEAVDALWITAPVTSLEPLSGLRQLVASELRITSDVLQSLAGLEALRGLTWLVVRGQQLRDIGAVQLSDGVRSIAIQAPIDTLDATRVKHLELLELVDTELTNLDAFENLESAEKLTVVRNLRLRDMAALERVQAIGELMVLENEALERIGDFPSLTDIRSIHIRDNDALTEFPRFPSYYLDETAQTAPSRGPDWLYFESIERLTIEDNDSLRHLVIPDRWRVVTHLDISRTQIGSIDFARLQSINTLILRANSILAEVNRGELSIVAYLALTDNHVLPSTAFDGVRTFQVLGGPPPAP